MTINLDFRIIERKQLWTKYGKIQAHNLGENRIL